MDCLMTFDSTTDAIQAETQTQSDGLKARLVGTPESLSADCGLSLKFKEEDRQAVLASLSSVTFKTETSLYSVVQSEDGGKDYKQIEE